MVVVLGVYKPGSNARTDPITITNLTNYETKAFGGIFFLTERVNIPLVWINYSAMQKAGIKVLQVMAVDKCANIEVINTHDNCTCGVHVRFHAA